MSKIGWVWLGVFVGVALYLLSSAQAHMSVSGFRYDYRCCSDKDCAPVPASSVEVTRDGYLWRGELFRYNGARVIKSPDGQYHGCQTESGRKPCLYVPEAGV